MRGQRAHKRAECIDPTNAIDNEEPSPEATKTDSSVQTDRKDLAYISMIEAENRYLRDLYKEKCKSELKQKKEIKRLDSKSHKRQIVTNHLLALKRFTPAQIRVIAHNKKYAHYTTEDIARNAVLYSINKSAYEYQYKSGGLPMPEKSTLERYVC